MIEKPDGFARRGPFLHPDYGARGLLRVPARIREALAGAFKRVLLVVLDGFGFDQWERYHERHPFLKRMTDRGTVSPITTVFPSTTAAAITTLHTGVPPSRHGVVEWWLWLDELKEPVETLLWRGVAGDDLEQRRLTPAVLYEGPTFYETLARSGVGSTLVLPDLYANSAYSRHFSRGATTVAARSLKSQLGKIRATLAAATGPAYVYTHWGSVDKMAHQYGPHSPAHVEAIAEIAAALETELVGKLEGAWAEETLLMITADHGQVLMDLSKTLFVNEDRALAERFAVPGWGSPRDFFVRAKPGARDELRADFERRFAGDAVVTDAIELFGPGERHPRLRQRAGDFVVLPHGDRGPWWELRPGVRWELPGMHGSLTPAEMLVPLAECRLSELRP